MDINYCLNKEIIDIFIFKPYWIIYWACIYIFFSSAELFYAPAYSQIEDIVTMLINNGVWIHHKNFRRQTALDTAVENKCKIQIIAIFKRWQLIINEYQISRFHSGHGKLIELLRQAETKSSASNPHQLLFK